MLPMSSISHSFPTILFNNPCSLLAVLVLLGGGRSVTDTKLSNGGSGGTSGGNGSNAKSLGVEVGVGVGGGMGTVGTIEVMGKVTHHENAISQGTGRDAGREGGMGESLSLSSGVDEVSSKRDQGQGSVATAVVTAMVREEAIINNSNNTAPSERTGDR